MLGLSKIAFRDASLENMILRVRAFLLSSFEERFRPLLAGISKQCFFNEYLYADTEQEIKYINSLDLSNQDNLVLYSCYKPLASIKDICNEYG